MLKSAPAVANPGAFHREFPGAGETEANDAHPVRRWRFGSIEFDERSLALTREGKVVEADRKPLEVLRTLLARSGKVVTKDALVQAVWPGRIVTDAAPAKTIARLRESLGDADHALIRTHHGYGYRLTADVVCEEASTLSNHPRDTAPALLPPATEHRLLTLLDCELSAFSRIPQSIDPETFRNLLLDYQRAAVEIGRRYEGYLAKQSGDGLLFYFGYPAAHDDDAERALRCACDLLAALARSGAATAPEKSAATLSLRIGVHTGEVVIGPADAGDAPFVSGASPALASQLKVLAEADTILISDTSFRLVPGLFVTRDFGMQELRGQREALHVHQVLQPSGIRSRLAAAVRLTPFVGRAQELARVAQCWREVIEGNGQAVLFSGEPGLGKSRLLMEIRGQLAGTPHTWLECRADALNRHSTYHCLTELLRRGLALKEDDDDALRLQRLEQGLDAVRLRRDEAVPLLAPLLNISLPERYPASPLAPAMKRQRSLEIFADWVQQLAHQQPLVLAFEDLHWIDEASLEFISVLLARIASLPVLLVMTARLEFKSPWL